MDRTRGVFRDRSEADLRYVITVTHRSHAPERGQQRIAYRRLRRFDEREQLVPRPVGFLERALAGDKIREHLVEALLAARQVLGHVVADLLEYQIVLRRVGDEYRIVLEHEVEGVRLRFFLNQLQSGNIEHLHGTSQNPSERGVRPQMVGGAGEPDQRSVAAWLGVNPLCVSRRHVAKDLYLGFDHAECLRVRAANGSPSTLDHRRLANLLFPEVDDLFHEPIEIWIERLDLRRIPDEIQWHLSV